MFRGVLAAATLALSSSLAQAATTGPFSSAISLQSTNWADSLSVPKFDGTLGALESVNIVLRGELNAGVAVESLDAAPATIDVQLAASVRLLDPLGGINLLVVMPLVAQVANVSAFDGTIDFGGTSGFNLGGVSGLSLSSPLTAVDIDSGDFTAASLLAFFTGTGNVALDLEAQSNSQASGAGNLITQFLTQASALVTVQYTYRPAAVPEPAVVVLLALGGLIGAARARRS